MTAPMIHTHALLGQRLTHSFSPAFFAHRFKVDCPEKNFSYGCYELASVAALADFLSAFRKANHMRGLNVTFPYKQAICALLDELSPLAQRLGAVNLVVRFADGRLWGHNTDYMGFRSTLPTLEAPSGGDTPPLSPRALICGGGGVGKAVAAALTDSGYDLDIASRQPQHDSKALSYAQLKHNPKQLKTYRLIVQATPLGTSPNTEAPDLPYEALSAHQLLYDLVYNPPLTPFLHKGAQRGCMLKNGMEMLYEQAEASWRIWQQLEQGQEAQLRAAR